MRPNPLFPADLVTFTEEILDGKLHFLCAKSPEAKLGSCLTSTMKTPIIETFVKMNPS